MLRRCTLVLATLVLAIPTAGAATMPAHTKRRAEVNVLRALPHLWSPRRLHGLVDRRTHLLRDGTEAVCRGRGRRLSGARYTYFVCVVRPHDFKRRQGLYLDYRARMGGRFTLRWLRYRPS
jgi:hypothetical protein